MQECHSSGRLTSLELNNSLAVVRDLVVDNDLHVEDILVHDPLDGLQVAPWASAAIHLTCQAFRRVQMLLVLKICRQPRLIPRAP